MHKIRKIYLKINIFKYQIKRYWPALNIIIPLIQFVIDRILEKEENIRNYCIFYCQMLYREDLIAYYLRGYGHQITWQATQPLWRDLMLGRNEDRTFSM